MNLQAHAVAAGLWQVPVQVRTMSRKSSGKQARSRPGQRAVMENRNVNTELRLRCQAE